MSLLIASNIQKNPKYLELVHRRNTLGWSLSIAMLLAYYGFICLIAWNKAFLSTPIGTGVTTIGVPIGLGLIVFTVLITLYYVNHANKEFDGLTAEILEEAK